MSICTFKNKHEIQWTLLVSQSFDVPSVRSEFHKTAFSSKHDIILEDLFHLHSLSDFKLFRRELFPIFNRFAMLL